MIKHYNLVELVEAWHNKEISTEEMKETYANIPKFTPIKDEGGDPTIYSSGSGNTSLEVKVALVSKGKMTMQEFFDWKHIVAKIERKNIEKDTLN